MGRYCSRLVAKEGVSEEAAECVGPGGIEWVLCEFVLVICCT